MAPRRSKQQAGKKQTRSKVAGEEVLQRIMELAEYEVNEDPYRGMLASAERRGPWAQCLWKDNDEANESSEGVSNESYRTVAKACRCSCPSLISWTREANELRRREERKRAGKRKRNAVMEDFVGQQTLLGRRREDPSFRCECDYNPLCLCSLGGAMDDVLSNAQKQIVSQSEGNVKSTLNLDSSEDDEVVVWEKSPTKPKGLVPDVDGLDSSDDNVDVWNGPAAVDLKTAVCGAQDGQDRTSLSEVRVPDANETSEISAVSESVAHRPCDVYTENIDWEEQLELDPEKEKAIYKKETAEQLLQLRKSVLVGVETIRSYFEQYIRDSYTGNAGSTDPADDYIDRLRRRHDDLLFVNPLKPSSSRRSRDSQIVTLAMPPGIQNLGATCYLNTQLQCLAQNIAFLDGIFSWREPVIGDADGEHHSRMNSVLSTMQLLLARMRCGAECTITTADFSGALGLENDEMQDPNEFGRLLFERMQDSFSSLKGSDDGQESHNLANLLPRIFHGVATYETTCLKCQQTSERNEGFMDLNLPIEKISDERGTIRGGMVTIKKYLGIGNTADSDVQNCLDKYTCAELLDGANQYWCDYCNSKQDAKRAVTFRDLPPVLNVQLSRYVFDRKKYVKKKLTDKVLLPQILRVPHKVVGSSTSDGGRPHAAGAHSSAGERQYLLCAVMKHQGNSAYRGHYVAECLDWHTGKWYEFNDDQVTVLSDGPSCSYVPPASSDSGKDSKSRENGARLQGSADAYNLYYVDPSFLAKCAAGSIRRWDDHGTLDQGGQDKIDGDRAPGSEVTKKVSSERAARHRLLAEMCLNDGRAADRLRRRRAGIIRGLTQKSGASRVGFHSLPDSCGGGGICASNSPVWVDGTFLRHFFSCADGLESILNKPIQVPLLTHKQFLCEHNAGLHPRVARRGKLLPREVYNSYVSLLLGEQMLINGDQLPEISDYVITPDLMQCKNCADAYRHELSSKLQLVAQLRQLYEALSSQCDDVKADVQDSSSGSIQEGDEYYYVVSRKFCAAFCSQFQKVLKRLESYDNAQVSVGEEKMVCICEGLDGMDLSMFLPDNDRPVDGSGLDCSVNANITCEHGNCDSASNKRVVRYISESTWRIIKQLFPSAICHTRTLNSRPSVAGCDRCLLEKEQKARVNDTLQSWATKTLTRQDGTLKKLFRRRPIQFGQGGVLVALGSNSSLESSLETYMVHKDDIKLWRKGISLAKDGKRTGDELLLTLQDLFLLSEDEEKTKNKRQLSDALVLASIEKNADEWRLCRNLRSLLCKAHHHAIASSFLRSTGPTHFRQLADHIVLLSKTEYFAFVASLCNLGKLLCRIGDPGGTDFKADQDTEAEVAEVLLKTHHPMMSVCASSASTKLTALQCSEEIFSLKLEDDTFEVGVSPKVCNVPSCCITTADDKRDTTKGLNSHSDAQEASLSDGENDISEIEVLSTCRSGNLKKDVQKDSGTNMDIRVFELDSGDSVTTNVSKLSSFLRGQGEDPNLVPGSLRRSSRKRKTALPEGTAGENVLSVTLDHNVAALRLLLYEKCADFPIDQELSFVAPCNSGGGKTPCEHPGETEVLPSAHGQSSPLIVNIPFEWNQRSLRDIFEVVGINKRSFSSDEHFIQRPFLVRHSSGEGRGNRNRKAPRRERQEGRRIQETLLDSLLEIANIPSDAPSSTKAGNSEEKRNAKGTRTVERGFRGTFLHSSRHESQSEDEKKSETPCKGSLSPSQSLASDAGLKPTGYSNGSEEIIISSNNRKRPQDPFFRCNGSEPPIVILDESDDDVSSRNSTTASHCHGRSSVCSKKHSSHAPDASYGLQPDRGGVGDISNESCGESLDVSTDLDMRDNQIAGRNSTVGKVEEEKEELTVGLLMTLTGNGNKRIDNSRCQDAIRWAKQHNPNAGIAVLKDSAYAKYLEHSPSSYD